MSPPRLALVNMPFAGVDRPSLGLGLLSALARRCGWAVDSYYFNLDFGDLIGAANYRVLCGEGSLDGWAFGAEDLIGEFLFAQRPGRQRAAFRAALHPGLEPAAVEILESVAAAVPGFIEDCADRIDGTRYELIGFTSTFEQTQACVALARAVRSRDAQARIAIGGANCEAQMGWALAGLYDCFDLVCTGEADRVFPQLLDALASGGPWWETPGFAARGPAGLQLNPPAPLTRDLDGLPSPDYDGYFRALARFQDTYEGNPRTLVLETSRGCWWGEHSHCSFCGLNATTMRYRSKTPEVAAAELRSSVQTYEADSVEYADNILNFRGLDRFLPALRELREQRQGRPEVFFETKSNLRRAQIRELALSGVTRIQPGIESFDDGVLRRMGKGVRGLQNIALLKWARHYGLNVAWNLLFGFPGESPVAYRTMARLVPRLLHLQPPATCAPIRLDRFSPHHSRPTAYGLLNLRPASAYSWVYDAPPEVLAELAYYFEFEYSDGRRPQIYAGALARAVRQWQTVRAQRVATLHAAGSPGRGLEVWDTRAEASSVHRMEMIEARLYLGLDSPRRFELLRTEQGLSERAAVRYLRRWRRQGLIAEQDGYALALATADDRTLEVFAGALTPEALSHHTVHTADTTQEVASP